VPDYDPSFTGYLRTLRSGPGFGVKVGAAAVFSLALLLEKGWRTLAVVVLVVLLVAVAVVYPIYRRRGPGPL
jgi:hypothetical protein